MGPSKEAAASRHSEESSWRRCTFCMVSCGKIKAMGWSGLHLELSRLARLSSGREATGLLVRRPTHTCLSQHGPHFVVAEALLGISQLERRRHISHALSTAGLVVDNTQLVVRQIEAVGTEKLVGLAASRFKGLQDEKRLATELCTWRRPTRRKPRL